MREVIWLLRAEISLQEIFERLEAIDSVLADEFLTAIDRAVAFLRRYPEMYRVVLPPFRRAVFGRDRRYGLFYVVEPRGVIIHALEDLRQDPEQIRRALGG